MTQMTSLSSHAIESKHVVADGSASGVMIATIETVTGRQNEKENTRMGPRKSISIRYVYRTNECCQVQHTDRKGRRNTLGIPRVKHCSRLRVIPNVVLCAPRT